MCPNQQHNQQMEITVNIKVFFNMKHVIYCGEQRKTGKHFPVHSEHAECLNEWSQITQIYNDQLEITDL